MTDARRPRRGRPPQAGPPGLLRPRDQERLRPARGVPRRSGPRSPSSSTSTAASPAWSRSKTCSRSSSAPIDDEHDVPTPADPVVPLGGSRYEVDATLDARGPERAARPAPADRRRLPHRRRPRLPRPRPGPRARRLVPASTGSSSPSSRSSTTRSAASGSTSSRRRRVSPSGSPTRRREPRGGSGTIESRPADHSVPRPDSWRPRRRPSRPSKLRADPIPPAGDPAPGERRPADAAGVRAPLRRDAAPEEGRADRGGRLHGLAGRLTQATASPISTDRLADRYIERPRPGSMGATTRSIRLDLDNMPQPDAFLYDPAGLAAAGPGSAEDDYIEGAPELVVEVASSSVSYDLHEKLHVYRRNGVQRIHRLADQDGPSTGSSCARARFERLAPGRTASIGARVFPGLWLDPAALIRGDRAAVARVPCNRASPRPSTPPSSIGCRLAVRPEPAGRGDAVPAVRSLALVVRSVDVFETSMVADAVHARAGQGLGAGQGGEAAEVAVPGWA